MIISGLSGRDQMSSSLQQKKANIMWGYGSVTKSTDCTSILIIMFEDCLSLRTLTRLVITIIFLWQPHSEAHHPKASCQPTPFPHCSPGSSAGSWKPSLHSVHLSSWILEVSFIIHDPESSNMFYLMHEAPCIT